MKCYKVVYERHTTYVSRFIEGAAEVEYKVGEFATAPEWLAEEGYHLLAFDTLNNALNYIRGGPIFEAEGEEQVDLPPMCEFTRLAAGRFLETVAEWPEGTVMFKRIKLLEEVA